MERHKGYPSTLLQSLTLIILAYLVCIRADVGDADLGQQASNDISLEDSAQTTPKADEVELEQSCTGDADSGPCSAHLLRYFYDDKRKRCRQFIYGGCLGNGNVYTTETECIDNCLNKETTIAPLIQNQINEEPELPEIPEATQASTGSTPGMLVLANGKGETSFTFSSENPFIQLKAVDITAFQLRYIHLSWIAI